MMMTRKTSCSMVQVLLQFHEINVEIIEGQDVKKLELKKTWNSREASYRDTFRDQH